jgi:allophanate hydrolase
MTEIPVVVVGAHLSGMPLNHELKRLGARLDREATSASVYKLYALKTWPPKPGLLRTTDGQGGAIDVEVWLMSTCGFGEFVAGIPAPLSIGTVQLSDGTGVKGFLVESEAIRDARDITEFGGWRKYTASSF